MAKYIDTAGATQLFNAFETKTKNYVQNELTSANESVVSAISAHSLKSSADNVSIYSAISAQSLKSSADNVSIYSAISDNATLSSAENASIYSAIADNATLSSAENASIYSAISALSAKLDSISASSSSEGGGNSGGSGGSSGGGGVLLTIPSLTGDTYSIADGNLHSVILANVNSAVISVSGDLSASSIGAYPVTFTPLQNCKWSDNSSETKTKTWYIDASLATKNTTVTDCLGNTIKIGNADAGELNDTQVKFGSKSYYSYYFGQKTISINIDSTTAANPVLKTGDFTIEGFFYPLSTRGMEILYDGNWFFSANTNWLYNAAGIKCFATTNNGSEPYDKLALAIGVFQNSENTISDLLSGAFYHTYVTDVSMYKNRWYHIAVVRHGDYFYLFLDGEKVLTVSDFDRTVPIFSMSDLGDEETVETNYYQQITGQTGNDYSDYVCICQRDYLGHDYRGWLSNLSENYYGYVDEFRVSTTARYTEDFTVPEEAFEPDEYTKVLLHFEG